MMKVSYNRLISKDPHIFGRFINSLGQEIVVYEDPDYGDDMPVVVASTEHQVAEYSEWAEYCSEIGLGGEYEIWYNGINFEYGYN